MWTRAELKSRAKECLKKYYWAALAVTFLAGILGGGSGGGAGSSASFGSRVNQSQDQLQSFRGGMSSEDLSILMGVIAIVAVIVIIALIVGSLFKIFVGNLVCVGEKRFFMESRTAGRSAGVGKIFYAFGDGNYLKVVKTMFLKDLFVTLWTLLFIIPGVIKAYQYYMVPYILAENPDMHYKEALTLSKEMMDGHKWNTFVLELSFIGWNLLGALLCGVGVIFVVPYVQATLAELYSVLRRNTGAVGLRGFGGGDDIYDNIVSEQ